MNAPETFEFNLAGGTSTIGSTPVDFLASDTHEDIAAKVAAAFAAKFPGLTLVRKYDNGIVHIGGQVGDQLDLTNSLLQLRGRPGVLGKLNISFNGGGSTINDAQTFSIDTQAGRTTFEFTKDANVGPR